MSTIIDLAQVITELDRETKRLDEELKRVLADRNNLRARIKDYESQPNYYGMMVQAQDNAERWMKQYYECREQLDHLKIAGLSDDEVKEQIAQFRPNDKIPAVKHIKDRYDLGLKEAKDLVDRVW